MVRATSSLPASDLGQSFTSLSPAISPPAAVLGAAPPVVAPADGAVPPAAGAAAGAAAASGPAVGVFLQPSATTQMQNRIFFTWAPPTAAFIRGRPGTL